MSNLPDVDIVVVGSHAPGLRIDVSTLPQPGETVIGHGMTWPLDGGKGSNQAIAAANLGARVAFVGRVGTDRLGESAFELLKSKDIDVGHLSRSVTTSTGCGVNIVDSQGIPEMITIQGANAELSVEHVSNAFESYGHVRVVLTQMEIDPRVALYAAHVGKQHGAISIVNAAPAVNWPADEDNNYAPVDILVVNEIEAKILDGNARRSSREPALTARLQKSLAKSVIITLGGDGLVAQQGRARWRLDAADVQAVDTCGGGDVFCAALAVRVAEGVSLHEASAWANLAAAISVTQRGTIPTFPTRFEVDTFAAQLRKAGLLKSDATV